MIADLTSPRLSTAQTCSCLPLEHRQRKRAEVKFAIKNGSAEPARRAKVFASMLIYLAHAFSYNLGSLGAFCCVFIHAIGRVIMDKPPPSLLDLARKLLAASQTASDPHVHEAVLVNEKLRISLTRFAGLDGFVSLLRRALALASAEVPALQSVKISADGRLEGFEDLGVDEGKKAAVALAAHLLGLLVTFIGEFLTMRLVSEAWPETPLDEKVASG
jgi:hypothetical protein